MEFKLFDLGLLDFNKSFQFQRDVFEQVKGGYIKSALILCQHYPVVTLGRAAAKENIRVPLSELENRGIHMHKIERAGDVTYHGPGQINAYPIFNLSYFKKDIHLFLRRLEETVICLLSDFGITGSRYAGLTGVWIGSQKIASIGIAIRKWITLHGLSLNIKKDDLENFSLIRPCGMDIEMTSLETILGKAPGMDSLKAKLAHKFREVFTLPVYNKGGENDN